jgi:hypothetical protein
MRPTAGWTERDPRAEGSSRLVGARGAGPGYEPGGGANSGQRSSLTRLQLMRMA